MLNQFTIIIPEILLCLLALTSQIIAVFCLASGRKIVKFTAIAAFLIAFYLFYGVSPAIGFSGSFEVNIGTSIFKMFVLLFSIMVIVLYRDLMKIEEKKIKVEFVTLILLSTVGIFISISARDFLLLFCGLELQALSGYALAAFNSKNIKSSEAGLKYFVLGSMMSAIMLLGVAYLYGFTGTIQFNGIKIALASAPNIALTIGVILAFASILFKLSAAPLHIWTPDVYEGAPIVAVTYFATAQKLGILVVMINFIDFVADDYKIISVDLIKIIAIISMVIGSLGAIMQLSLKRLMAYSTILNVGYVLMGVAMNSWQGKYAAFLYMLIYTVGVMGFFTCLIALFGQKSDEATFDDLRGLASTKKALAATIAIIMFSMIGLPPLAGFFVKYYVFYAAIQQGEIILALIGVISSVIAAFYYLKVIKYMYFVEAAQEPQAIPTHSGLLLISTISLSITLFFGAFASSYII